jgi:hypothetical protein
MGQGRLNQRILRRFNARMAMPIPAERTQSFVEICWKAPLRDQFRGGLSLTALGVKP